MPRRRAPRPADLRAPKASTTLPIPTKNRTSVSFASGFRSNRPENDTAGTASSKNKWSGRAVRRTRERAIPGRILHVGAQDGIRVSHGQIAEQASPARERCGLTHPQRAGDGRIAEEAANRAGALQILAMRVSRTRGTKDRPRIGIRMRSAKKRAGP